MKLSYKFYHRIYAKVPSLDWQHTYQLFWGRRGGRGEGGGIRQIPTGGFQPPQEWWNWKSTPQLYRVVTENIGASIFAKCFAETVCFAKMCNFLKWSIIEKPLFETINILRNCFYLFLTPSPSQVAQTTFTRVRANCGSRLIDKWFFLVRAILLFLYMYIIYKTCLNRYKNLKIYKTMFDRIL